MPFNIFEGDSGLKDDWDGMIVSAVFEQNQFADKDGFYPFRLKLVVEPDDGENPLNFWYNVGNAWESYDGQEVVRRDGHPEKGFRADVAYFKYIQRAAQAGAADEMQRRSDDLYDHRGTCHAGFWVGLKFHYAVEMDMTAKQKNDATGQFDLVPGGKPVIVPVKYLGVDNQQIKMTVVEELSADDVDMLTELATNSDSWTEFGNLVIAANDSHGRPFRENKKVVAKLTDDRYWSELRSS